MGYSELPHRCRQNRRSSESETHREYAREDCPSDDAPRHEIRLCGSLNKRLKHVPRARSTRAGVITRDMTYVCRSGALRMGQCKKPEELRQSEGTQKPS